MDVISKYAVAKVDFCNGERQVVFIGCRVASRQYGLDAVVRSMETVKSCSLDLKYRLVSSASMLLYVRRHR